MLLVKNYRRFRDYILGLKEFEGEAVFTKTTMVFEGVVILSHNVAHIFKYKASASNRVQALAGISILIFLWSASMSLSALLSGSFIFWVFPAILSGTFLYWIFLVRKHGITIATNDGHKYHLLNQDKEGSEELFQSLTIHLESGGAFRHEAYFQGGQIVVQNSSGVIVGDGNQQLTTSKTETEPSHA